MALYDDYLDAIKKELHAGRRQWKRGDKVLEAFGYKRRRQTAVDLINQRLNAKGISTEPKIDTSMALDRAITFYLKDAKVGDAPPPADQAKSNGPFETVALASGPEDDDTTPGDSVTIPEEPPIADEEATGDLRLIIGNFECAENRPLQINPSATVEKALTEMAFRDYSQLVVTAGPRNIRGIVSYKSIAQAFLHGSPKTVFDCLDKSVPKVERDEPLLRVIDHLTQFDAVIIIGPDKSPTGIVTPADIAAEFGDMVTPFLLIGEIEEQLRWLVREKLDLQSVMASLSSAIESESPNFLSDLTMWELHRLIDNDENWVKIGIKFDRAAFCRELDAIREIRNAVMHFRELPKDGAKRVKQLAEVVRIAYISKAKKK